MSERGCMFNGETFPVDNSIEVRDLTTCDTWMASFVTKYLETSDPKESIRFVNEMKTIVVQKKGVTTI